MSPAVVAFQVEAPTQPGDEAMKRRLVLTLLAGLWPASVAAGQPQEERPRFEVGGGGGVIAATSGGLLIAVGPRVSINLTDRIGFDLIGDIISPTESSGVYGIYTDSDSARPPSRRSISSLDLCHGWDRRRLRIRPRARTPQPATRRFSGHLSRVHRSGSDAPAGILRRRRHAACVGEIRGVQGGRASGDAT